MRKSGVSVGAQCIAPLRILLVVLFLAGCGGGAQVQRPTSLWGEIITLGAAEQMDAPALVVEAGRVTGVWIGADASGVHQDARVLSGNALLDLVVLPLPPRHPYGQQVAPGLGGDLHLLWLDDDGTGETRLYSAFVTRGLVIERGPVDVSRGRVGRYTLLAGADGSAWAVWGGGLVSEPELWAARIDTAGRPLLPQKLGVRGDWPTFVGASDGTLYLYWLEAGAVWRGILSAGVLEDVQTLTTAPLLESGDRLHDFYAGMDTTHGYVFWNITRADGTAESWMSAGEMGAESWPPPSLLSIDMDENATFETGFNSGAVMVARAGETGLAWARPVPGQHATLPAAVGSARGLGIVYLQGGAAAGYQTLVAGVDVVGTPLLLSDREFHLYVAWAQPGESQADLRLTMTRR